MAEMTFYLFCKLQLPALLLVACKGTVWGLAG